jgi:hypothetical protein
MHILHWLPSHYFVHGCFACAQGFTMLKLANPHGKGSKEWSGAWSDTDMARWKMHPEVSLLRLRCT